MPPLVDCNDVWTALLYELIITLIVSAGAVLITSEDANLLY